MFIRSLFVEPWGKGVSNFGMILFLEAFKMKYHQRNDDSKFIISLALVTILAALVVAVG